MQHNQLKTKNIVQQLANATKTYYLAGGHYKAMMNKEKKNGYADALRNAGEQIPTDEELLKIGIFNGDGAC